MPLLLILVLSALAAIPIDWAIQYQAKMMWGATTTGKRPIGYQFGPSKKVLAMIGYLIPADVLLAYRPQERADLWVILSVGMLLLYVSYTSFLAIRSMDDRATENE